MRIRIYTANLSHETSIEELPDKFVQDLRHNDGCWCGSGTAQFFIPYHAIDHIDFGILVIKEIHAVPQANDQSGNIEASGTDDGATPADVPAEPAADSPEPTGIQPASPLPDAGPDSSTGRFETVLPGGTAPNENNPG